MDVAGPRTTATKLLHSRKITKWIQQIGLSSLPPYLKLLSFQNRLRAQLAYSFPVVMLTRSQCDPIFRPALPIIKHALGLPKSFSNSILFLEIRVGGYGFTNLYLLSLSAKMEMITRYQFGEE